MIEIALGIFALIFGIQLGIITTGLSYYVGYSESLVPFIVAIGIAIQSFTSNFHIVVTPIFAGILIGSYLIIKLKDKFIAELHKQLLQKGVY